MFIQHVHEYIKKTIFMKCLANHTSGKLKCLFATSLSETMEFKKKNTSFPDAKHGRNNGYQTLLISGPVLRIGVARTGA
jgi:hypothetical protein